MDVVHCVYTNLLEKFDEYFLSYWQYLIINGNTSQIILTSFPPRSINSKKDNSMRYSSVVYPEHLILSNVLIQDERMLYLIYHVRGFKSVSTHPNHYAQMDTNYGKMHIGRVFLCVCTNGYTYNFFCNYSSAVQKFHLNSIQYGNWPHCLICG